MAEPLKNSFGPEVPARLATMIASVWPDFDSSSFERAALDGLDELELTARARHISAALADHLPEDRARAMGILTDSLSVEIPGAEVGGMASFVYLPWCYFISDHGLDCFEESMHAQYELTKRFTAEFSIRAYLEHHPEATLERLTEWTADENVHVRRLVSEGSRPRLPWAPRLRGFQADPEPVLRLLERLKDDPEEYVRRSVANNLNDIAKDHPDRVVEVAREWWSDADENRRRLIRHGLRTLIKAGDQGALAVLGYTPDSPARVVSVECTPSSASIGGKVRVEVVLENPSGAPAPVLVDLSVHFVKARGATTAKVFKGAVHEIQPGDQVRIRKTISLKQHSTRKHYPGDHAVEVLVNGLVRGAGGFSLTA